VTLETVHGNRFNIRFESDVGVFFFRNKIKTFLLFNNSNTLLKLVLHDMETIEYLAGVPMALLK